ATARAPGTGAPGRARPGRRARGSDAHRHSEAGSSLPEAIADAANRVDVFGLARVAFELLAEVTDVHVDRPRLAVVGAAPEFLQEHLAGEDPTRVRGHGSQELELDVGELHLFPLELHGAAADVDPQRPRGDDLVAVRSLVRRELRATEQRAHPAAELPDRERLRDVVVRAQLEPDDLIELVVAGR